MAYWGRRPPLSISQGKAPGTRLLVILQADDFSSFKELGQEGDTAKDVAINRPDLQTFD